MFKDSSNTFLHQSRFFHHFLKCPPPFFVVVELESDRNSTLWGSGSALNGADVKLPVGSTFQEVKPEGLQRLLWGGLKANGGS